MSLKMKVIDRHDCYAECYKCRTRNSNWMNMFIELELYDPEYKQKNTFCFCEDCLKDMKIFKDKLIDEKDKIIYYSSEYNCYTKRVGNKIEFYVLDKKVSSRKEMENFLRDLNDPNSEICKKIEYEMPVGLEGSRTYYNFMKEIEIARELEIDHQADKAIARAMAMDWEDDDESWRICREDELDDF